MAAAILSFRAAQKAMQQALAAQQFAEQLRREVDQEVQLLNTRFNGASLQLEMARRHAIDRANSIMQAGLLRRSSRVVSSPPKP